MRSYEINILRYLITPVGQWFLHFSVVFNSCLESLPKNADPKPSPRHSDLIGLNWDSGIFIFNERLFGFSLTMYHTLRTLALDLKSQERFWKIIYNSQCGTWAWSWKQPAFPLHLCLWKTGTLFCNCASYSEVSYINSLCNYTQEHHGLPMHFCRVVFNFNYLFSTGSCYSFQDALFSFLIDLILTQILYL